MITNLTKQIQDLSTGWLQCDPGPLFKPEYYSIAGLTRWVSLHPGCLLLLCVNYDLAFPGCILTKAV